MSNLLLLIALFFLPYDWITSLDTQIDTINQKAILKKSKQTENDGERVYYSRYKLGNQEKMEVVTTGRFVDSMIVQYYSNGDVMFANRIYLIADYIHKGAHYPGRAEGEMTELREYYHNDQEGIQLRRTLDYFPGTNLDSLHQELLKEPYDTLLLTNEDYVKSRSAQRRLRKGLYI